MKSVIHSLLLGACLHGLCWGAPSIAQLEPVSLTPGKPVDVTFIGAELTGATGVWTSAAATIELTPGIEGNGQKADRVTYRITLAADAPQHPIGVRVASPTGISNLRMLAVEANPATLDAGAANPQSPLTIVLPGAVDGHIDAEQSRYFRFVAGTGQRISFDVWARRLGSPLDAVIRVLDTTGREVFYLDDTETTGPDPRGSFTFATAGDYILELRDVRYRGGADYAYHLRMGDFELPELFTPQLAAAGGTATTETTAIEPNEAAEQATPATVPGALVGKFEAAGDCDEFQFAGKKGDRLRFVGQTRAFGSAADLLLRVYKPDDGKLAEDDDTGGDEASLEVTLQEDGNYRLRCEELNRRGGAGYGYRIDVQPSGPGFALVAAENRYNTPQGTVFKIKINAQRRDFNGPITLTVEGLDGATIADNVLGEGANEVQLTVTPPAELAPGSIKIIKVWGTAKVGETEQRVLAGNRLSLRQELNGLPYPPSELGGIIAIGVGPPPKAKEDKK